MEALLGHFLDIPQLHPMRWTLGQYFAELRNFAVPYPPIARETIEVLTDDALLAELVRRRWGTPRKARKIVRGTREEWNVYFLRQQQERRGLSMDKVAERAGVDTVTMFEIECDKGVRASTVRQVMEKGLGFAPGSAETRRALALLTAKSAGGKVVAADLQKEIASVENRRTFNQFLERAVPVLATIPAKHYEAVLQALGNPATVEAPASLNKVLSAALHLL